MSDPIDPPEKSNSDYMHTVAKLTASAIPGLGGFLSEVISLISPPYEKRKKEWMKDVSSKLQELEEKNTNFKLDDLENNEDFLDAILAASKAAISTKSKSKKTSLLNALQNIALDKSPRQITDSIFLNYIDLFTDEHIVILKLLEKPFNRRTDPTNGVNYPTYRGLIENCIPNIDGEIISIIVDDLFNKGLITRNSSRIDELPNFMEEDRTLLTTTGIELIKFIREP